MKKLKRYYERLCIWFSYYKVSNKIYDFDSYCILELERHQLKRLHRYISKYHYHEDSEYNLQRIQTAINILDLLLDYSFKSLVLNNKFNTYINLHNYKRFMPRLTDDDVNHINRKLISYYLYQHKLWYIYNKLKYNYFLNWWE